MRDGRGHHHELLQPCPQRDHNELRRRLTFTLFSVASGILREDYQLHDTSKRQLQQDQHRHRRRSAASRDNHETQNSIIEEQMADFRGKICSAVEDKQTHEQTVNKRK